MPGQFDLQPSFPIQGVADLIANRPAKEAAMRAQQQQQLVQGLQQFGQGVQSLVDRRNQMAQALALGQLYNRSPQGQAAMGTNQVPTSPTGMPVTQNQTAAFDPSTGSVTPNQSSITPDTLQAAFLGVKPGEVLNNIQAQKEQQAQNAIAQGRLALEQKTEPQKLEIEARRATAEEENNKIQRMIQGMLATANIKNQTQERAQAAEKEALEANKETAKHFILHPIDAYRASKAISQAGAPQASTGDFALPDAVGKSVKHPSGVTIKRTK